MYVIKIHCFINDATTKMYFQITKTFHNTTFRLRDHTPHWEVEIKDKEDGGVQPKLTN